MNNNDMNIEKRLEEYLIHYIEDLEKIQFMSVYQGYSMEIAHLLFQRDFIISTYIKSKSRDGVYEESKKMINYLNKRIIDTLRLETI